MKINIVNLVIRYKKKKVSLSELSRKVLISCEFLISYKYDVMYN